MSARPLFTVRLATPADADAILSLTRAAFAQYRGVLTPPSSAERETRDKVVRDLAEGGAVLAWSGSALTACARFRREPGGFHVHKVSVDPACRGQGLAKLTLHHVESLARAERRGRLTLGARKVLKDVIGLYEGLGFRIVGEDGDKSWHMEKTLEPR